MLLLMLCFALDFVSGVQLSKIAKLRVAVNCFAISVLRFAFYLQLSMVLFLFRKLQLYLKNFVWISVFGFFRLLCLQK